MNLTKQDIDTGNFNPSECFKYAREIPDVNVAFKYPMDSFLKGDGYWDVNNSRDITEAHRIMFRTLMNLKFDEVYFMQEGQCDGEPWFILAKVKGFYIYFEASCDYTGFDCRGGGTFGYSNDWKTVWNMYCTNYFRTLVGSATHGGNNIADKLPWITAVKETEETEEIKEGITQ